MSANPSGTIRIDLQDNVSGKAKQISAAMGGMEAKSKSALSSMQTGSVQATQAINQKTAAVEKSTAATNRSVQSMHKSTASSVGMITSVAALGSSFVLLEASMSRYDKALLKIQRGEAMVKSQRDLVLNQANLVEKGELALEKARAGGKKSAEEIAILETDLQYKRQKLETDTIKLTNAQEKLRISNMDYNDTLKQMAVSMSTTFLTAGTSVTMMISQMAQAADMSTGAFVKNKASVIANSGALKALGFNLQGAKTHFTGAAAAARGMSFSLPGLQSGLKGVGLGIRGVITAMGPLGLAMTAISILWAAWDQNLFGLREAVHDFIDVLQQAWKTLEMLFPPLKLLGEGLKSVGIDIGFSIDQWQEQDRAMLSGAESIDTAAESVAGLSEEERIAAEQAAALAAEQAAANEQIDQAATSAAEATEEFAGFGAAIMEANKDVRIFTDSAREMGATTTTAVAGVVGSFREASLAAATELGDMDRLIDDHELNLRHFANQYNKLLAEEGPEAADEYARRMGRALDDSIDALERYGADATDELALIEGGYDSLAHVVESDMNRVAASTEDAADRTNKAIMSMQQQVEAFEIALKKNQGSITIDQIISAAGTMDGEAYGAWINQQAASGMMSAAARGMYNTGFFNSDWSLKNIPGLISANVQAATNNWANTGQNMQHHGLPEYNKQRREWLKKGVRTYGAPPGAHTTWSQADRAAWESRPKGKYGGAGGIAVWEGNGFKFYPRSSAKYKEIMADKDPASLEISDLMQTATFNGRWEKSGIPRSGDSRIGRAKAAVDEISKIIGHKLKYRWGDMTRAEQGKRSWMAYMWSHINKWLGSDRGKEGTSDTATSNVMAVDPDIVVPTTGPKMNPPDTSPAPPPPPPQNQEPQLIEQHAAREHINHEAQLRQKLHIAMDRYHAEPDEITADLVSNAYAALNDVENAAKWKHKSQNHKQERMAEMGPPDAGQSVHTQTVIMEAVAT